MNTLPALGAVRKLFKELDASAAGEHLVAFGGSTDLAAVLRRQFLRGGADPGVLRFGEPEGAAVYLHVVDGVGDWDGDALLKRASRARVPAIAVVAGHSDHGVPYVPATDVVRVPEGRAFPLEAIAHAVAHRLGERGAPLAARVPVLRAAVCERLVESFARRNALLAAAGSDLPVLALNELRLVLRIAQAHGEDTGRERVPELVATLAAGVGLRAVADELRERAPRAGWAVRGAVAYTGTRALGEAAKARFALGRENGLQGRLTRLRAGAVPVAP